MSSSGGGLVTAHGALTPLPPLDYTLDYPAIKCCLCKKTLEFSIGPTQPSDFNIIVAKSMRVVFIATFFLYRRQSQSEVILKGQGLKLAGRAEYGRELGAKIS